MEQYDYISKLCENIYFGKYPCDEVITLLKKLQINLLVNLTENSEDYLIIKII